MKFSLDSGPSIGKLQCKEAEIRAFGPQILPLSDDVRHFGIKKGGADGWARCRAAPEVWLEFKNELTESNAIFHLRFCGLQPEAPVAFVFYIKAQSCQIGNEKFKPLSLRKFNGLASQILFPTLQLETNAPRKVQLIPLAGQDCFWGCEFLVSFEMSPFDPKLLFIAK